MTTFEMVPAGSLFTSEPDPRMFGNAANTPSSKTWTNANWLKSRFHFSFAEYHDSNRSNFGAMRVMNDDLVQPSRGFGTHGHRDAEICTYIVKGSLTHADSMCTSETLTRGAIQFMTAGSGVRHSEFNNDSEQDLRFIQMWFTPRASGLTPNYGSDAGDAAARNGAFHHVVSDVNAGDVNTAIKINADVNLSVAEVAVDASVEFTVGAGRQAYLLCVEGDKADVSGEHGSSTLMSQHDAAKITGPTTVTLTARNAPAHWLVVDVKK